MPRHEWPRLSARDIMTPLHLAQHVRSDVPALDVLRLMEEDDVTHLPVTEGGEFVGTVNRDRVLRLIQERVAHKN